MLKELFTKYGIVQGEKEGLSEFLDRAEKELEQKKVKVLNDVTDNPNWIPKTRFDKVNTKKNNLETQLEDLAIAKADIENYKTQLATLNSSLASTKKEFAVKLQAQKAGFHNSDDVLSFVKLDDIKVNDKGELEGVDEAINGLAESKPYLLASNNPTPTGSDSNPGGDQAPSSASKMSFEEYFAAREKGEI